MEIVMKQNGSKTSFFPIWLFIEWELAECCSHTGEMNAWSGNLAYRAFSQWADALLGQWAGFKGPCAAVVQTAAHSIIFITDTGLPNQIS